MTKYRMALAFACLSLNLTIPAAPTLAEANVTPDYSKVTSRAQAERLAAQGKLVKILLFPGEFGGEDAAHNIVYVPEAAADAKDLTTGTLIKLFEDGLIDKLTVEPEYKGKSVVPARIVMKASHSGKDGKFEPTVEIW